MGDTIAFVARESPVSGFVGVKTTLRNCFATVNKLTVLTIIELLWISGIR